MTHLRWRWREWLRKRRHGRRAGYITLSRSKGRFPTIRGENPPQGIGYDGWRLFVRSRAVEVHWWRW